MFCSQCGAEADAGARFCQNCGVALVPASTSAPATVTEEAKGSEPIVAEERSASAIDQSNTFLGGIYHPWRRFFARYVDIAIAGCLLGALGIFDGSAPQNVQWANARYVVQGMIFTTLLLWPPVEAAFLAATGTTPGKWVFGIRVVSNDGRMLSYGAAMKRAYSVCVQGLGLGVPQVAFFTLSFAYKRLTKTGATRWDVSAGSIVAHEKWGVIRAAAAVIVVVLVGLMLLGFLDSAAFEG